MKQVLVLLLLNHISIHVLCLKDIYIVGLCKKKKMCEIFIYNIELVIWNSKITICITH